MENDNVVALHSFLDKNRHPINVEDINDQARHLMRLVLTLRLRDARFICRIRNGMVPNVLDVEVITRQPNFLVRELFSHP